MVTYNLPFGRWGEVFGDDVVAAAMIDRLVHHAEVISLKGDSYRLKYRDLGRIPASHDHGENPRPGPYPRPRRTAATTPGTSSRTPSASSPDGASNGSATPSPPSPCSPASPTRPDA